MNNALVGIIMGSDSDLEVMQEAAHALDEFGVAHEIHVVSAHRTPDAMATYAKEAKAKGLHVIIAGAGGAAHLPGMTASYTTLPVIGVPVKTKNMEGLDSLASIMQMPKGVPVATVAINGAFNAGLLAVEILSLTDASLQEKLETYKNTLKETVIEKNKVLQNVGYEKYPTSK